MTLPRLEFLMAGAEDFWTSSQIIQSFLENEIREVGIMVSPFWVVVKKFLYIIWIGDF